MRRPLIPAGTPSAKPEAICDRSQSNRRSVRLAGRRIWPILPAMGQETARPSRSCATHIPLDGNYGPPRPATRMARNTSMRYVLPHWQSVLPTNHRGNFSRATEAHALHDLVARHILRLAPEVTVRLRAPASRRRATPTDAPLLPCGNPKHRPAGRYPHREQPNMERGESGGEYRARLQSSGDRFHSRAPTDSLKENFLTSAKDQPKAPRKLAMAAISCARRPQGNFVLLPQPFRQSAQSVLVHLAARHQARQRVPLVRWPPEMP